MKQFILILFVVVAFFAPTQKAHALFGRTAAEKQRRIEAEQRSIKAEQALGQQITSAQQTVDKWQGVSFVLGIGCVVTLVAGAAIGSNGRKHVQRAE
jgi:hypothetical protein